MLVNFKNNAFIRSYRFVDPVAIEKTMVENRDEGFISLDQFIIKVNHESVYHGNNVFSSNGIWMIL